VLQLLIVLILALCKEVPDVSQSIGKQCAKMILEWTPVRHGSQDLDRPRVVRAQILRRQELLHDRLGSSSSGGSTNML
jgi:hypothetical protein